MPLGSTNFESTHGGPGHFAGMAANMGTPAVTGSWEDVHLQIMRLKPGGWSHPGTSYLRLTVPLSKPGRVRRRLPGAGKAWEPGVKRQGTVSVTPPGTEGEWEWMDDSHFGLLFLPEALLRGALDDAGEASGELSLRPVYAEPDRVIGPVFNAIQAEIEHERRNSRLLVSSAVLFLTRYVLLTYGGTVPEGPSMAALGTVGLNRVFDAIEARLGYDWSVPEMAREAGLSPFWFAHIFKEKVGISPSRYVQQRRLARARTLLRDRSMSIADIAAQCGFESQSWFTTTFRRHFGDTPAGYRQELG